MQDFQIGSVQNAVQDPQTKIADNSNKQEESNIYRVIKESHIDKILLSNKNIITMVIFCYGDPKIKIFMKRHMANTFKTSKFVLALLDEPGTPENKREYKFEFDRGTYVKELNNGEALACVFFFYDAKLIAKISNADSKSIVERMVILLNMLDTINPNHNSNTQTMKQEKQIGDTQDKNQIQSQTSMQQNMMMKMAREYQVEKMLESRKLHELAELQELTKLQKRSKSDNNKSDNNKSDNELEDKSDTEENNDSEEDHDKDKNKDKHRKNKKKRHNK